MRPHTLPQMMWYAHGSFGDDTFTRCNQWGDLYNCGEFLPTPMLECESGGHGPNDAFTHTWLIGPFTSTGGYDWFDVEFKTNLSPRHQASALSPSASTRACHPRWPARRAARPPADTQPPFDLGRDQSGRRRVRIQGDSLCAEGDPFACQPRLGEARLHAAAAQQVARSQAQQPVQRRASSELIADDVVLQPDAQLRCAGRRAARTLTPIGEFLAKHHSAADSFYTVDVVPMHNDSFIAFEVRPTRSGTLLADPSIIRHHSHVHNFHSSFSSKRPPRSSVWMTPDSTRQAPATRARPVTPASGATRRCSIT